MSGFKAGGLVADFFVLRTPLLPFEELEDWSAGLEAPLVPGNAPERLAAALEADRARLRARLREISERPEVREALFVASPDLEIGLEAWRRDPDGKKGRRAEEALVRYFLRMTTRSTPFGLFSGCSVGTVAEEARLTLAPRAGYRRRTRLDMDYLFALAEDLERSPELRPSLRFRPNSSLYQAEGGATLGELSRALVEGDPEGEITLEEAEGFIGELIDSQILVSDLAPPVAGREPVEDLIDQLARHPAAAAVAERLRRTGAAMADLDRTMWGAGPGDYRAVSKELGELPASIDLQRLFQVDMIKPASSAMAIPSGTCAFGSRAIRNGCTGRSCLRWSGWPPP